MPSINTLSMSALVPTTVVNVPAAAVFPPITIPSAVPPSISGVLMSGLVSVLLVKVSVVSVPTKVAVVAGSVTVTLPE